MTKEEIMELDSEALELRFNEVKEAIETNAEGTDFEALSLELDSIKERKSFLAEEARKADIQAVINEVETEPTTIEIPQEETRKMADIKEIRNSEEYVKAFANYIKTEDDSECRALLSELVTGGQVPVPSLVEEVISTAWERDEITSRVKKSYIKGILRVGFELSATGAVVHTEGADAPDEETLTLGIVELKPASIKKWISISDEVLDLQGEAFIRYIYDELTYQIAKKASDEIVALIDAAPATATATAVSVGKVTANTIALDTIASAVANLSDRATNPVVIMNKATYAAFKALQYGSNYAVDVFEGMDVIFNNSIDAYSAASTGDTYAIVGDLSIGVQANFPNGEEIKITEDRLSLAEADLVKFVGREYVALGLVADKAICKIVK
jgi:HK97 family phage major capsid protein